MYRMERPDDFLPLYTEAAPTAEPGAEFHYSNAGFVLLAALVEEVTGQEFVPAVTERVLRPTGMASSGYFRSDEPVPDVAVGYLRRTGQRGPMAQQRLLRPGDRQRRRRRTRHSA